MVRVIGAGLAGSEAAYQLAIRGIDVELIDIKPNNFTEAHTSTDFAELVCSNSLRSSDINNAVGLLKEEMRILGSLIMEAADSTAVPSGGSLSVDRNRFSSYVTEKLASIPRISIKCKEVTDIPEDGPCIVCTGPLTTHALSEAIIKKFGDNLYFFDAIAPIVDYSSIDLNKVFWASRYGKGTPDYLNCPMSKSEYLSFRDELSSAECAHVHDLDKLILFEGCMPIEEMAKRGIDTMRFGPLKPVGLDNPVTGEKYYAVVQLRRDDSAGDMFNIVGFQTHLKQSEQKRVFSMIPGLENAVFLRYGTMHRNTYINSPKILDNCYRVRNENNIFFAGQITGVEGYIESASSGMVAGINLARQLKGLESIIFTNETAIGALSNYVSDSNITKFTPMNVNFGLFKKPEAKVRKRSEMRELYSKTAINSIIKTAVTVKEDVI